MAYETAMTDHKCKYCGRIIKEGFPMNTVPKKKGGELYAPSWKYHPACYKKAGKTGQKKAKSKKDKYYYFGKK